MRRISTTTMTAALLAAALATPALARDGGSGGDREPAGGAYMTSYPEQGSTGIQAYGTPRSVDVPRDPYGRPAPTGYDGYGPRRPAPYGYR